MYIYGMSSFITLACSVGLRPQACSSHVSCTSPIGNMLEWYDLIYIYPLSPVGNMLEWYDLIYIYPPSPVGNMLEWYDFLIYIYLGNVISKLFFPPTNVYARLLALYGIFAAGGGG